MNPYLLLLGAFAFWYIPGAIALYKLEYSLKDLQLVKIKEKYIDLGVNFEVKNVTKTALSVSSLNVWIYIDGVEVTEMLVKNVYVNANSTEIIGALFRVEKDKIPSTIWYSFIKNNFKNSNITFKGIARANGRPYPFIVNMTVGDLVNYINS